MVATIDGYAMAQKGQAGLALSVAAIGSFVAGTLGTAALTVGRRTEQVRLTELSGDEVVPVLRAYLKAWAWEVGAFFDGVGADSTDAELAAIAPRHPVFVISPSS